MKSNHVNQVRAIIINISRLPSSPTHRPYTEETLVELGASGVKNLVVVPVSFVSEHIETLVGTANQIRISLLNLFIIELYAIEFFITRRRLTFTFYRILAFCCLGGN
jgi:protoheme ferro-lyase